jgi:hypothetical protein
MYKIFFFFFIFFRLSIFAQLGFNPVNTDYSEEKLLNFESNIAYKLPYRGNNYKFYGTISYHVFGKAYAEHRVHNTIVEAFKISEHAGSKANFKIYKTGGRKNGFLIPLSKNKNGYHAVFMTPLKKNNTPVKYYYRSGFLRVLRKFDHTGYYKYNKNICIDYDNMALFLLNLNEASKQYGLKIQRIIFNKRYIKNLFSTIYGDELKQADLYFAKYLSKKVNRKYDDLFYIDFSPK